MARFMRFRALALLVLLAAGAAPARGDPAPAPRKVVHYLPFPADVTYKVWQGNDQGPSHNDKWNRHAFDFSPMPESSPICATADGTVVYVKEDTAGPTGNWRDNNEVVLLHADGTVGTYLHLEKDGATVDVGDVVYAGDVIGRAGNTGNSRGRHLHFGLRSERRTGPSIPCRFEDVSGGGVPKTGDLVVSRNVAGRPLREAIQALETLYDDASALDAREVLGREMKALVKRPPREIARALEKLGMRPDFVDLYVRHRDALLARHAAEAARALERLRQAIDEGDASEAVYRATVGKKEFADLEARKTFTAALKGERTREGYSDALKGVRPRLSLRDKVVRALARDLDAREKEARGKPVRWKSVLDLYGKALEAARSPGPGSEETADRLRQLMAPIAARVSK